MMQLTGMMGEKIVELALLQEGWIPINFNATLKNAPNVDIIAVKDEKKINVQVKTSGKGSTNMLQLGYGSSERVFNKKDGPKADVVAFVRLFSKDQYEIYVVPIKEAERVAKETYQDWVEQPKRDGTKRDGNFPLVIRFTPNKNRMHVSNYQEKWSHYMNAWNVLDELC